MSTLKLKILIGSVFFVTVILVLLFIQTIKKMRKLRKGEEVKEAPNFVLENIKKSLSERNLIKEELKKSEGMGAVILKNIDLGIGIFDELKILKNANPMFLNLFNLKNEYVNKSITLLKDSHSVFYNFIKTLRYNHNLKPVIQKVILENKILEIRTIFLSENEFGMKGFLIIADDVTEMEKTKKQLELKERLEVMGEMSAGIAHEFKNSLSTLKGYSQMIEGKAEIDSVKKYASKILKEVDDINAVVNSFLLYAKPIHTEISEINAKDIQTIIKNSFRNKTNVIKLKASQNFSVNSDPVLLKQCIVNIIKNSLESCELRSPEILVKLKKTETGAKLIFKDNGKGMGEDTISKVFIPFFTTKDAGTGLGLALCEKIVSELGGKISIDSEKNIGTTVEIEL